MVSIQCLSPANTNHLFKQLRYLFENKRAASVLPRQSNKFSWLQDKFRKFCPTMACGLVFSFIFATREGTADRFLKKKKNQKCQSKEWQIRESFIMESSYITFRENGNKMICQTGNRIRALPGAEYLPLIMFSLLLILPYSFIRNKYYSGVLGSNVKPA